MATTGATRDRITCHALDTLTGRPAAGISCSLACVTPAEASSSSNSGSQPAPSPSPTFTGTTNADGRIANWSSEDSSHKVENVFAGLEADGVEQSVWTLSFDTGAYFGEGKTFWPEVKLSFFVRREEKHYHVPLLLGPWSYTTYRGS